MFKILHASADYFLCSFEFENLETGEHIFADYFDDPLYELLTKFNLDYDHELVGKEIEAIPADLFVRPEEWAMERSKQPFAGAWLYPWLKQNDSVTQSKKRKGFKG
uniref:hypothetical protein n=1 Tax=Segatella hominis TaxID=2518605 RepID=UPI004024CD12